MKGDQKEKKLRITPQCRASPREWRMILLIYTENTQGRINVGIKNLN